MRKKIKFLTLLLAMAVSSVYGQQGSRVTGTVEDQLGPVAGAAVQIKGTTTGTVTDVDGKFVLNASPGQTLVVSFIGYVTKEVKLAGEPFLSIRLEEDSKIIDEVVVTALGITRSEKALGYAVQKLDGTEFETVKGVNIATSLTGRVSGLRVFNSSEFNVAPSIQLRGESPLIVVDGVPTNQGFADFNQDVIENITVLKGATASALYGSRGGNGAIMITTKKGGQRGFQVEVNSSNMFYAGELKIPKVQTGYSSGIGGKYNAQANYDYVWGDKLDIGRTAIQWDPFLKDWREMELTSKGKNNFQDFLQFSIISNNTISISSKGENGSIRTSLSYLYDKNQYPNTYKHKYFYNIGGELKLGNKASIEGSLNFSNETAPNTTGYGYGTGYMYNILVWTGPEYRLKDFRDYWKVPNESQNWMYTEWYDNPWFEAYEKLVSINNYATNGSVSFKYQILPWLKLQLRSGGVVYANNKIVRSSMGTISKNRGAWTDGVNGSYKETKSTDFTLNNDFLLLVDKKFNNFSIDGLFGGSLYYYKYNYLEAATKNGLLIPGFYSLKSSVETPTVNSGTSKKKVNSLFGTVTLGYNDAVYLDATGRNDWSSTLPQDDNAYFYPSLGSSVILSELIDLPNWLPFLKLRGSWTVSKSDLGIYALNQAYSITQNRWDGLNSASFPSTIRGSVKPITNRTWEVGANMGFLNNRIKLDVSYYDKLTYNNTREQTISSASGFSTRLMNIDEEYVRRGVEFTVDVLAVSNRNFSWNPILNLSTSRRYYAKLDEEFSADDPSVYVGGRTDYYNYLLMERDPDGNIVMDNGYPKFLPVRTFYGYQDPDFEWGLANTFKYRDFTLTLNIDGRFGGLSWDRNSYQLYESGSHPDLDNQWRYDEVVNGKKNYIAEGVKVVSGEVKYDQYGRITEDTRVFAPNDVPVSYMDYVRRWNRGGSGNEYFAMDETFLKLRELSLSYNIPKSLVSKLGMNSCSFGLIGQNLLIFTKEFEFTDPDNSTWDDLVSPSVRYIGFNLKANF
jgi:TonB-linked SusC/RagA family outer membrane protein